MIESIKKNKYGILLMLCSSVFVCFGQYFWKKASGNWWILALGFLLYGCGAIAMLIAYKFGSMSVLQPILSLNYVFALIIGHYLLGETVGVFDIIGVSIIIAGVLFIGVGDSAKKKEKPEEGTTDQ